MKKYFFIGGVILLIVLLTLITEDYFVKNEKIKEPSKPISQVLEWTAPDKTPIPATKEGELIRYGRELMPFGTTYKNAQLTNEQAWDVAAFVNSQPRLVKDLTKDWPNISTKPFDYLPGLMQIAFGRAGINMGLTSLLFKQKIRIQKKRFVKN
jgi:cytochrome c